MTIARERVALRIYLSIAVIDNLRLWITWSGLVLVDTCAVQFLRPFLVDCQKLCALPLRFAEWRRRQYNPRRGAVSPSFITIHKQQGAFPMRFCRSIRHRLLPIGILILS